MIVTGCNHSRIRSLTVMETKLFRSQAVEHQRDRLRGDVLLLPRFSHSLLISILLLWFVAVLLWLVFSSYARKETVFGWLEPPTGIVRIYAQDGGIIQKVLVAEGEFVEKDQPLVIISGDRFLASGDQIETRLLEEYEQQQKLINEQLQRVHTIYTTRKEDLEKRIFTARQELRMVDEQLKTIEVRYGLISKQVEGYKSLKNQGHVSTLEYDNILAQELALRSDRQTLLRSQISQKNLINQLKTEQQLLPEESENTLDQLREKLSEIAQNMAQLSGQRSHIIKSTRSGIVNNLQAIEGQKTIVGSSVPLLTLLPSDISLSAHLLIPVRSAGFVEAGQRLDIRYDAFPYQKFGLYEGVVENVSRTLLLPNELLHVPVPLQEPVYRVVASLKQSNVDAYGKQFPLKPGMTLNADIRLGERSLIQWLLEPVYSLQGRI